MKKPLKGKRALVTGSGGGLGRSHALLLAERGAELIVHDINSNGANETADLIRKVGEQASVLISDVRNIGEFRHSISNIGKIDILVNNAGVGGKGRKIEEIDIQIFDEMFEVHVRGTFFATQAVLPKMKESKSGKIINISSIFAMGGHDSISHYAAAKSAISGLTKSWAREFAPWGINVNAVAPGFVETDMTRSSNSEKDIRNLEKTMPLGRFCAPIDISYAVAWLASAETNLVSGQIISPNSGAVIVGY
ncbi:MAG: SDR family oxidoreductase [Pseudomonadota bacterium]|nr:SDR family oxidoreductase [Pseudomonadota bacterium]